jgi:hypothetical protein
MGFICFTGRRERRTVLRGYFSGRLRLTGRKVFQPRLEDLLDALGVCFGEPVLLTHAAMRPQCGSVPRFECTQLDEKSIA